MCYSNQIEFIETIKKQNSNLCEKIEAGFEFSIVFSRKQKFPNDSGEDDDDSGTLVVIRVANEIRDLLKANNDRIYYGTNVHRVLDRFYVKCCAKCHRYGHYHAEYTSIAACGYCMETSHTSENCHVRRDNDFSNFKCVNCERSLYSKPIAHTTLADFCEHKGFKLCNLNLCNEACLMWNL